MEKNTGNVTRRIIASKYCEYNRPDLRGHFIYRFPGLRYPRQQETVASDTLFSIIKSSKGNNRSYIFVEVTYDWWSVFPLKIYIQNGAALQDYSSQEGVPPTLKTDIIQSDLGIIRTEHCRLHCIEQATTEPHSPRENSSEPKIDQLSFMVRNTMRKFKFPLKEHYLVQKWCVHVNNIASSKKLDCRILLKDSEGFT